MPGTLLASEVGRWSFPNCSISLDSDIARMIKLCGHIQCSRNTHLLGELGHAPAMNFFFEIIHSELVSEIVSGHKYHSFTLNCMLTSRSHESNHTSY